MVVVRLKLPVGRYGLVSLYALHSFNSIQMKSPSSTFLKSMAMNNNVQGKMRRQQEPVDRSRRKLHVKKMLLTKLATMQQRDWELLAAVLAWSVGGNVGAC